MLKRAFILLSGTVTGLVGVLSYNPPHLAGAMTSPLATSDQLTTSNQPEEVAPTNQASAERQSKGSSQPSQSKSKAPSASRSSATATQREVQPSPPVQETGANGTFLGNSSSTKYGPVQVQITVTNGVITNAQALAYPSRDRRSIQISQAVIPWLAQETLRIQSASVMAVSGATITTNAWNNSLASALQKAGK